MNTNNLTMTDNLKESDILIIKKIHAAWGNYDDPENGLIPYQIPNSIEHSTLLNKCNLRPTNNKTSQC